MVPLRSTAAHNSCANSRNGKECYQSTLLSSKMVGQTRLPPTLRHKPRFPYEYLLERAITRRCMHVHAVLSSFKGNTLSTMEERISRWLHHLDV